jgi:hypothetical protein
VSEISLSDQDDNQVWILTNYLSSEVRIMRGTSFAGIALDPFASRLPAAT